MSEHQRQPETAHRYRDLREPIATRLLIIAVWLLANAYGFMLLAGRTPS